MEQLDRFLHEAGVHPELIDLDSTVDVFLSEMELGLQGKPSSLQMLPSYIGENFAPRAGECVAAVDAGGTNLRISKVRFGNDLTPDIEAIEKFRMPGSLEPVDMDMFFDGLAESLAGILEETQKIGFCFSYPVEILPSRDGRAMPLCKEVVVHGIEGAIIGQELQKALKKRGARPFTHLSVLNDTTASLLGGRLFCKTGEFSSHMGFILGTGTNMCYYEENARIPKAPALFGKPGRTIVNLESGEFDKMTKGALDDAFTAKTLRPDAYRMEKMVSGQYLGALLLEYLHSAAQKGLFSQPAAASVLALDALSTRDIDGFMAFPHGNGRLAVLVGLSEQDRQILYGLVDAMFERAARLVTLCYTACALRSGAGRDPLRPILVTAEGTTYYKCELLKTKIEYYIECYLKRRRGLYITTARVENVVTYGAALSAVCV